MSLLSRIANAFRPDRLDGDLADEHRFHLEARVRDLIARGMSPAEAGNAARRQFGNPLLLSERSRDARLLPWLESLVRDARYGVRMLRKDAVVTAAAALSLALAIGACAAAFTLIDALILRQLPVRDPQHLVYLTHRDSGPAGRDTDYFSYPLFLRLQDSDGGQADLFGMSGHRLTDTTFPGGGIEKLRVQYVSGSAFGQLGIGPALGRVLAPDDDRRPGAHPVAVISHSLWMRRFGGSPAALGQWVALGEKRLQVIGVARKEFTGVEPGVRTDLWAPVMMFNQDAFASAGWTWLRIFGRLRPGATRESARQSLAAAADAFRREHPREFGPRNGMDVLPAANGPSYLRRDFQRPLWILGMVAALVLLIAASNVSNLFLARAAARRREWAMRIAIGAGRGRLIQQSLVESALLVGAACGLALLFAGAAAPAIVGLLTPADNPAWLDLRLDFRAVAFVVGLGGAAAVTFGLVPALRAGSVVPDGRSSTRIAVLRPVLGAQVGLSFMVLFIGGLLVASFHRLTTMDLGFSTSRLALFMVETQGEREITVPRLLERVRAIPGVRGAGASSWALFDQSSWTSSVRVGGAVFDVAYVLGVAPGFFDAMNIRLSAGRDFDARDGASSAIVNEAFASRYLRGARRFERSEGRTFAPLDVIGVVRDAKYLDLRAPAPPTIYLPLRGKGEATLEVRTAGDPKFLAQSLRAEINRLDPAVKVRRVAIQSTLIDNQIIPERLLALLSAFFTIVALALAAIGLYGVLSYAVVRRTREIGIRVALGARQPAVVRLVISEIALVMALGLAAGAAGALAVSRFVAKLLYDVKPTDPASLGLPLASLLLACALAAIVPALRASRVDPTIALRCE